MTVADTTSILPNHQGSEGEEEQRDEERRILAGGLVDGVDGMGDNNVDHAFDVVVGDPTAGNGESIEDDEDGALSPEDLLLKAVASSTLRSNSSSREDADVLRAAQLSGQPQPQLNTTTAATTRTTTITAADKVDHEYTDNSNNSNSNNNESTSNNKIAASNNDYNNDYNNSLISPPPTGLPTRDRHVALPGAFSAPGPAYTRTTHADFYDEEVAEATVSASAASSNNNNNNHNNSLLPTLEATLVVESASTTRDDSELVQAAVLVSKEESLSPSSMDKATRKKRLLCWGVLAAVVLLVVVGFTMVLTMIWEDGRVREGNNATNNNSMQQKLDDDDEGKSTESDDADNIDSASRSLRGLYCSITHCGP